MVGTLVEGRGEARADGTGPFRSVGQGALVGRRGEVRTLDEPLTIRLSSGVTLDLSPQTEVALPGNVDLVIDSRGKLVMPQVELRRGEVLVRAREMSSSKDAARPVLVRGPGQVVAVARSGLMAARALSANGQHPAGLVAASYEGDARVATRGAFKPLAAGQVVELHAGRIDTPVHPLVAGPSWLEDNGVATTGPLAVVSAPDATGAVSMRFAPVDGAMGYDAELARDHEFRELVVHTRLPVSATAFAPPPLSVGRYFARVRALGSEGLPGFASDVRSVRVALVLLPPGSVASGGSLMIPEDRTIAWDDPRGLETSLNRIGFVSASREVGLTGGREPTPLRVRIAGDKSSLPLTLVPRPLRADVEILPKRAAWPRDSVEARVRLVALHGLDTSFEPRLRVAINLIPIAVLWRREGDTLTAHIPSCVVPGPWVVQVVATDPHGNDLGRGYLEVDAETR